MTRSVSRGISSNARTSSASRRPVAAGRSAPRPTCRGRAGGGTPRRGAPRPRRPRGRPRRSAARRGPDACAGTSSPADYTQRPGRRRHAAPRRAPRGQAEDVDRARRRAPSSRRPSRTASRGDRACAARAASSGVRPSARWAASADECVQPEPCAAPSGWRSPGIGCEPLAVEEDVGRLLAVPAGDHDHVRAERVQRAGELLGVVAGAPPRPASTRASGRFGVITVARGSSALDERRAGVVVEQHRAGLGDHHGVDHDRRAGLEQVERLVDRRDDLGRAEHADLHRVDADVLGDRADLLDDERRPAPGARRSRRPCSARSAP